MSISSKISKIGFDDLLRKHVATITVKHTFWKS